MLLNFRPKHSALLFILLFVVAFSVRAASAVGTTNWYVSSSSTGACTTIDPYCATIQAAVTASSNGDTINVAPGNYSISTTIIINKPLTLRGATYLTNKNGYITPALYAWDSNTESIITVTNDVDAIALPAGATNVTIEGFVIQAQNRSSAGLRNLITLAQNFAYTNINIRNNVLGPNTNTALQNGTMGRAGIVMPGPNCSTTFTNSSINGNLFFDLLGDSSGLLFVCAYSPTYHGGASCNVSFSGTFFTDNEFRDINRSAIELVGNCRDLSITNNYIHNIGAQPTNTAPSFGTAPNNYTGTIYDWQKFGNGILVIRGSSDVINAGAVAPADLTISSNTIQDNEKNGIYIDAAIVSNVNIASNTISNNGAKGAPYLTWDGVRLDLNGDYHANKTECKPYPGTCDNLGGVTGITVNNNVVIGNGGKAVNVTNTPTNDLIVDATINWFGTTDRTAILAMLNGPVTGEPYYVESGMSVLGGAGGAPPTVTNNQSGDDTWLGADPGSVFDVDFTDIGGTLLNNAQYTAWTGPAKSGSQTIAWTDIATAINASSYSSNWGVNFSSLSEGTNYVSVRVFDNSGNVSLAADDVFFIKKDTTVPSAPARVDDGIGTSDIAYTNSTTALSASWPVGADAESGIARYWYAIGTSAGGTELIDWTNNGTALSVTKTGLTLNNGSTYYFSVKAENSAGNFSAVVVSNGQTVDTALTQKTNFSPENGTIITTSEATITFTTNKNADCKWSLTDQAYGEMASSCTGGGTTSQSCSISGLAVGDNSLYFACLDSAGNADPAGSTGQLSLTYNIIESYTTAIGWQFLYACPPVSAGTITALGTAKEYKNNQYVVTDLSQITSCTTVIVNPATAVPSLI